MRNKFASNIGRVTAGRETAGRETIRAKFPIKVSIGAGTATGAHRLEVVASHHGYARRFGVLEAAATLVFSAPPPSRNGEFQY